MAHFFSFIFFIDSIIAFYLFLSPIWLRKKLDAPNKALHLYALASAIWSPGSAMLFVQTDTEKAYFWRSFAIFGTVLYMITVQFLICHFAEISKRTRMILNGVALTGIVPYLLSIQRGQTEYFISKFGMTYRFKPGLVNDIYTMYFVVVSCNILGVIIHMIRSSEKKRMRLFGKRFLLITILILLGTILDMVFPAVGLPALPGSNLTQFLGLIILFYAMDALNRTAINVSNMSEFIYYSLAMPVLVFDEQYKLRIANEAAFDFFKLPKEKYKLNTYRIVDFFESEEQQVFDFEETHYRLDTLCRTNLALCNLTVSKIKDDYGDLIGYIVNVQDVSERMQYIKELQKARKEADSSNSAKSQFLANMSHEIRTPMNAIIGFSELALQEHPTPALTEYLEDIKVSSHNLLTLINDILDISKIESGKLEIIPIKYELFSILNDCYNLTKVKIESKPITFEMHINDKLPSLLYGDEVRIRQIINNFLSNAVKYTKEGKVTFCLDYEEVSQDQIRLVISVSDTGIGIKEEDIGKLFQSFTRIEEKRNRNIEGTGLGLNLTKNLVDLMGGEISVTSTYGKGSCFTAKVPQRVVDTKPMGDFDKRYKQYLDASEDNKLVFEAPQAKILVVDDVEMNLKVVKGLLKSTRIQIDTAVSGRECLEFAGANKYDIIFLDHMMPEMDGIETLQNMKLIADNPNRDVPVIMLTANAIVGAKEHYMEVGFTDYLTKPIQETELLQMILKYLPEELVQGISNGGDDKPAHVSESSNDNPVQADVKPAKDSKQMLSNIDGLDIQTGLAYCMNEEDFYVDMLKEYVKGDKTSTLDEFFDKQDWSNYRTTVHALKSTSLTIGAVHLSEAAKALEMAAKNEDAEYIRSHHKDTIEEYVKLIDQLNKILD